MGELRMSAEERKRLELVSRVREGQVKLAQVAEGLGVSYRQTKRIWRRYRTEGDVGLVHRLRGRASNRAHPDREAILARYAERYAGFGPTLASEYLAQDGWSLHPETLRRWLCAGGAVSYRRRRRGRHRQWRERRACFGELIQIDGSLHDWFEGQGPQVTLMVMIDDATSRTLARFYPAETTEAAMDLFERWVRRFGLPMALYPDHDSIYVVNRPATMDEQLAGEAPRTQFGRAMNVLGVKILPASSPQAKGRVERRHGLFQDRLIKALRLEGLREMGAANRYLETHFLPTMNRRWTIPPASPADLHRPVPPGLCLREVLSVEESRTVARDYTIRFEGRLLQITRRNPLLPQPRRRVLVRRLRSGALQILYRNRKLDFVAIRARPRSTPPPRAPAQRAPTPPAATHPWKRYPSCATARTAPPGPPGGPGGAFPPHAVRSPRGHSYCAKEGDISIVV